MTHITITGDLGSGKSAVSRLLSETLGYAIVSTGSIQRSLAAERGMTTLELNKYTESHPEIDDLIDDGIRRFADIAESHIIDSRLAWFFLPSSFKVYLTVEPEIAADRILGDAARGRTEAYATREAAMSALAERKRRENARFLSYYGADCTDLSRFDFVTDTSHSSPSAVAARILSAYRKA
ncbi:MAG: dephospho-CoA kinase [Tannerellaceae bacterium]|jgi:cytidylate kinase|nr:dephospho-CoA kinase [Tannerellaceae bacterium]